MHAKQERVESLNYYNDTVFRYTCVFVCFATKQVVLFIEAVPFSTPYCLPSLLVTANQISRTDEAPHGSCVYEQYTRQDHPMGNTEKILQYYKGYSHKEGVQFRGVSLYKLTNNTAQSLEKVFQTYTFLM